MDWGFSWVGCDELSLPSLVWGWSRCAPLIRGLFHWGGSTCDLWVSLPNFRLMLWPSNQVWCPGWWCICDCGTTWPIFAWNWCLSSTLFMSRNSKMQCLGRRLCCNYSQICLFFLACFVRVSPSQWAQKVPLYNHADHRHERTRRSCSSHLIVSEAVTDVPPALWLGSRGGQGKPLPSRSSLQWSGPFTSELISLPSCAGNNLEGKAGRSWSSVLFTVCTPRKFHCPVPGV